MSLFDHVDDVPGESAGWMTDGADLDQTALYKQFDLGYYTACSHISEYLGKTK